MNNRRPVRRDDGWPTPGEVAHLVVNVILIAVIVVAATLGYRALSERYEEATSVKESSYKPTHDSLQISYTYDEDKQIRWYVFVDPDTNVEYLFNDLGGCTPRLGADGVSIMRTNIPSNEELE